ncbi:low-density lipoprotein receptor-related protein 8 [Neoarius graeffei]|uniref:low-density lipoprotein receptor-related protein 8 n=1 Tax=Neoarius graeffei TaxID=443677 RepID=UPI00298D4884|nr:low-density lipoprotein receptor-related protein 8 [Neoarius graeffei]
MRTGLGQLLLLHVFFMETFYSKGSETACETGQFRCRNGRCIPTPWRCDDDDDCSDNSDEEHCLKITCSSSDFTCKNGQCVPARWKCDGEPECLDGSDEADSTCSQQTCPPENFDCGGNTNKCVSLSWRCDGETDCENGADEEHCAADAKVCPPKEFQCRNGMCVAPSFVCDGDDDCGDNSDEEKCTSVPASTCSPQEFRCNNSECIPALWSCDGDPDCRDKSDELVERCNSRNTPQKPGCPAREFQCGSGECIHLTWKCDGDADCKDKSDEADCPTSLLTCRPDQFQCGDGSCIHGTKQCNYVHDCPDFSDEAGCINKSLNECAENNGGCSHICRDQRIGYECDCPSGYTLLDQRTCGDIDECENPDACSQICINYKGDYKCECYEGYEMDPVSNTCKAVAGQSPYLIFTNRHEIRRIGLVRRDYMQVAPTLKNAVALDVDVTTNKMYWCDLFHRKIFSAYINKASNSSEQVTLIDSALHSPEGIAVDWVHNNIYWTDSGHKTISVATSDGKKRKVLVDSELSEPRAIALDPRQGFMYWSDWGMQAKIEKAGLNGVDRQVLVSERIEWPNGITLDLSSRRLYWVDSKLHLISSVDLNGDNRRVLLSSTEHLGHPFALTLFEDRVYWTDLENEAIYSVNRLTGHDISMLAQHLNSPLDVVVFHELRQPKAPDSCNMGTLPNGGCEYLCLRAPQITEHSPKYTCACPDDAELGPDMRRCVAAAGGRFFLGNNITVAVLGVVIPIVVLTLACTGGYLVWRNWRRRNTKSMNFDNPVYRKTTEEDDDEIHIGHSEQIGHIYPARVALSVEDDGLP